MALWKCDKYVFGTLCACDVSVLLGSKADMKVHIDSRKHQNYFLAMEGQENIRSFFQKNCKYSAICAECLFAGCLVIYNLPINVSHHARRFFRKICLTCKDAKRYSFRRMKTNYHRRENGCRCRKNHDGGCKMPCFHNHSIRKQGLHL